MLNQLTDPSLPAQPTSGMGLTPAEQNALGNSVDPRQTLGVFQEHNEREQNWLDEQEYHRMAGENRALKEQLQNSQAAPAVIQPQTPSNFGLSDQQMDDFGEMLPVVKQVTQSLLAEQEARLRAQHQAEKQAWQQEATAPLIQTQQELKRQTETLALQAKNDYDAKLLAHVNKLGYATIDQLVQEPEFAVRYAQPAAIGMSISWGDLLKHNIDNRIPGAAEQMLTEFVTNTLGVSTASTDLAEVPGSAAPARPASRESSAALQKRESLLAEYRNNMVNANSGIFPAGMNRVQYKAHQQDLRRQIDAIPTL